MASELQRFIYRSQVLSLYRSMLRIAFRGSKESRKATTEHIRHEFQLNRSEQDTQRIRYLISEGKRQRQQLEEMLLLSK